MNDYQIIMLYYTLCLLTVVMTIGIELCQVYIYKYKPVQLKIPLGFEVFFIGVAIYAVIMSAIFAQLNPETIPYYDEWFFRHVILFVTVGGYMCLRVRQCFKLAYQPKCC